MKTATWCFHCGGDVEGTPYNYMCYPCNWGEERYDLVVYMERLRRVSRYEEIGQRIAVGVGTVVSLSLILAAILVLT